MLSWKIRILHLIASNFVGGPEKQILRHAVDATDDRRKIWIGSFRDGPHRAEILQRAEPLGLPTLELASSGRFDPRAVLELARAIRQKEISLLCTHGYKANIVGWLASQLSGCPQVAFVRGWTGETLRVQLYEWLERRVLHRIDWVVCVSRQQAERLKSKRRGRRPPITIPNAALFLGEPTPADPRALKHALGLPEDAFLLGAVGRFSVEKGHRYLLEAALGLASRIPRLYVLLLGEGRERAHLEKQCASLGLKDRVLLPGFQKDIQPWMQALDILVNPSLTEGTPNVLLEAMSLGIPVIATRVGGVPDLIQDRESGLLVPPADAQMLAKAIAYLFEQPSEARRLAHTARHHVQQYSPAHQRRHLLQLYARVLDLPQREPSPSPHEQARVPFISVVLPVRNEESHIGEVLESLLAQDYPPDKYELLVVDGDSDDSTPDIVREFAQEHPQVRLLRNSRRLASAARNLGIQESRGEVIAFIDGHVYLPTQALLSSIACYLHMTGADCLARPQPLFTPRNNRIQDAIAAARHSLLGHGLDSTIYSTREGWVDPTSAGAVYYRNVFDRVGTFDERFDACEDVEFNYRVKQAGLRCYLSPSLTVRYVPRASLSRLFTQMRRYGRGRALFHRKHRLAFDLLQVAPVLFWGITVAGTLGAAVWGALGTGTALLWAFYAVAIALTVWIQGRDLDARQRLWMGAALPIIHAGLALGWIESWLNRALSPLIEDHRHAEPGRIKETEGA